MNGHRTSIGLFVVNGTFVAFWMAVLSLSPTMRISRKLTNWPDWSGFHITENRELAVKPDLRTTPAKQWGSRIEAWYSDSLPWRAWLIQGYRDLHFKGLKTGLLQQIPGEGGWVFRRGGTWAELDDYLGAFELTPAELDAWAGIIEGRREWAAAHGTRYLQMIASDKAQIHPEKILPALRAHRGMCVRAQLERRLAASPARPNVLFTHEALLATAREVYYPDDHHVNAYGAYVLYQALVRKLSEWFPGIEPVPFYDEPPADVRAGRSPGCYEQDRRLMVVVPGARQVDHPLLRLSGGSRHPQVSAAIVQPGDPRMLIIGHDSFMRYPLYSWYRSQAGKIVLPFGSGFSEIVSLMFKRFETADLDAIVSKRIPDVIVEQFAECRLGYGPWGLDETMRRAAAYGRASPLENGTVTGRRVLARCVLERVSAAADAGRVEAPRIDIELLDGDDVLDTAVIAPGVRRAVFFKPVTPTDGRLAVRVRGGTAASILLTPRALSEADDDLDGLIPCTPVSYPKN